MDSERDLNELREDLRSTTEDVAADAAELRAVESTKGKLHPADPALLPLAKRAAKLGKQIAAKTSTELGLANKAVDPDAA